jgi:hypothetical protein
VILVSHGLWSAEEVLAGQQDLWRYVTGSWLTYRTRTADRRARRWPVDPVWQTVQAVELTQAPLGVVRGRIAEATERQLVTGATGYLSSLAAMHPEWNGLRDTLEVVAQSCGATSTRRGGPGRLRCSVGGACTCSRGAAASEEWLRVRRGVRRAAPSDAHCLLCELSVGQDRRPDEPVTLWRASRG